MQHQRCIDSKGANLLEGLEQDAVALSPLQGDHPPPPLCSRNQGRKVLLANCFPWQLYHTMEFVQVITKNFKHQRSLEILWQHACCNEITHDRVQFQLFYYYLIYAIFKPKPFFQHKYFNSGTLLGTIVPNQYGGSVRYSVPSYNGSWCPAFLCVFV